MFLATKAMDTTRLVIDASGYAHRVAETDIYDSHNYEQDPAAFRQLMPGLAKDAPSSTPTTTGRLYSRLYRGQPYFVSEFGGIWWDPRRPPTAPARTAPSPGATGNGSSLVTRTSSTNGSAASPRCCWATATCSATAAHQLTDAWGAERHFHRFDRA